MTDLDEDALRALVMNHWWVKGRTVAQAQDLSKHGCFSIIWEDDVEPLRDAFEKLNLIEDSEIYERPFTRWPYFEGRLNPAGRAMFATIAAYKTREDETTP